VLGWTIDTPVDKYLFCLGFVVVFALLAKNLVRSAIGREWMAIRDMDVAAAGDRHTADVRQAQRVCGEFVHHRAWPVPCGDSSTWVPGSLPRFPSTGRFQMLFMVIIGGLGSIMGSFFGAAFIVVLPIFLNQFLPWLGSLVGADISTAAVSHTEFMIFGALIVWFLIVEPHGLARLWSIGKQKLRLWPFPH
jgi:branched-chain amino acid transport system permease protein